ncbi:DNA-directed RNA polymerase core subunit rpc10 [Gnomoniopsis sp. IMI 355080]|nr:DNA-directed RNA polymerase core subunit rpc10 [Gnomoniopsis sp. IMI 355080]
MSREGYTVPTTQNSNPFEPPQRADNEPTIRYLCGDCGSPNQLKKSQPVTCLDCGCRVLYKERTKRMIQFEAR